MMLKQAKIFMFKMILVPFYWLVLVPSSMLVRSGLFAGGRTKEPEKTSWILRNENETRQYDFMSES